MKKQKALPKVSCPRCDGSGQVDISQGHFDVLQILRKLGTATSWDVFKHADFKDHVTTGAVVNRLDDLFQQGLAVRVRKGRAWLYSPA